ncbi:MAG: dinitrogenase iron-molybdenum cofactor biosynthesis protein [Ruminiclostridium sp.]|nr:dinitrogenase iron-molybdenum cofactor biosynthesis protein [Ruminiclostridium sp.]MBO5384608.1 dinitrogenase iron-molybdenum cofactor biosynthesis protein [Ruminococcus sp.]MBQ8410826.1 dinitrogenase iron-molybdenum cofactor biosynthesis protein [Ruminiclostridium sp.]MBQ8841212.1 dinitrogenase iron-molybdenum cofactor biosynthesis protein [Ruminiclostridium sp.]
MKIAVTYENGQIFQHFGHTEQFKLYETENGEIKSEKILFALGSGHGALAGFLALNGVDALICGGIGGGAKAALADEGITLYCGVTGNADDAVKALLKGTLSFNPDILCSHHSHEHGEGHSCGSHGCGSGSCGNH